MIGEFRYFESNRLLEAFVKLGNGEGLGVGQGLITGAGKINPYPFDPEQPSMSVNSVRGIWRNLNFIRTYDINTYHYGFVVDYRNINPIVHIIINNQLVYSMQLPDIYQPLFPLLYANTQGSGVFANEINFGATPFTYNPKQALVNAGIDASGFVSGWGHINNDVDADNVRDIDEAAYGTNILFDDSDGDGIRDGDEIHLYNSSPTSDDSDSDGMPDGYELALGQNLLIDDSNGDIDNDGQSNIDEYNARTGLVDTPPTITLSQGNLQLPTGSTLTLQAVAADILDGNLSNNIIWSDSLVGDLGITGATYQLTPAAGSRVITASVTDSGGNTAVASMTLSVVDPSQIDTDNDGLFDQQETLQGTDPNNPDTDGDGLLDGDEVNVHATNPLDRDSDSDNMWDNFEVTYGLLPNDPSDALLDPDLDRRTNLQEFLDATNPNVVDLEFGSPGLIDNGDAGTSSVGSWSTYPEAESYGPDSTYATVGGDVDRYRFTPQLPVAGLYEVQAWNSCYNNRAPDVLHTISHNEGITSLSIDQDCDTGSHGEWLSLGQYRFAAGNSGYLEISDEGLTAPTLTYMGADAARFIRLVGDMPPSIIHSLVNQVILSGTAVNLSATAMDPEDGDITANIQWTDDASNDSASGEFFSSVPSLGVHLITASVIDSDGYSANASATVTVIALDLADDDNDGIVNSDELLIGTDPIDPDSDHDGIPDGAEVANNFDPLDPADAVVDSDSDGRTNLEEFLDNGNPLVADTGDANGDGLVDIKDVLLLQQVILDIQIIDSQALSRCDIYRDGLLTLSDLLLLQKNIINQ